MPLDIDNSTPLALTQSFEKLMLDTTEPLDPLIALQITNLAIKAIDVAYQMGRQDGNFSMFPETA